jgi:hypothetical protein
MVVAAEVFIRRQQGKESGRLGKKLTRLHAPPRGRWRADRISVVVIGRRSHR